MIAEFQGEYRWLSNFWPVTILVCDVAYASVEHAYQASKSNDPDIRERIRQVSAGGAKRIGGKLWPPLDWNREGVMLELVRKKFEHPALRDKLLATGSQEIQEGNYWRDEFWGVNLTTGKGQNKLGKIIMQVRDEIRANAAPDAGREEKDRG